MENQYSEPALQSDSGPSAPTEAQTPKKGRKTINGVIYLQDSIGCYVPESLLTRIRGMKIRVPKDALPALAEIRFSPQEVVMVIDLDGNNQVIAARKVTMGLVNQSQIHPREIYRGAIVNNAVSIMVAHNHPSGNLEPSESDLIATRRLVEVSKTIGIPVLDHLIVSGESHLSIRERYPAYFN